jgi:hypothetical protein
MLIITKLQQLVIPEITKSGWLVANWATAAGRTPTMIKWQQQLFWISLFVFDCKMQNNKLFTSQKPPHPTFAKK